jgi:hypothetical protein
LNDNLFSVNEELFSPAESRHWPPSFVSHMQSKSNQTLKKTRVKNRKYLKNMELNEQNHYMLSYEIKKTADEAKKEINNRINKLWRPLDSGKTSNGLLAAIRETTQKRVAWVSSKQTVKNNKYRNATKRVDKKYMLSFFRIGFLYQNGIFC